MSRIGELLVSEGLLTVEQFHAALKGAEGTTKSTKSLSLMAKIIHDQEVELAKQAAEIAKLRALLDTLAR